MGFRPAVYDRAGRPTIPRMIGQICVEVCPFEAIKMDKVFELSRRERFDALLLRKSDLAKSNEYYHSICPTDAAGVDAKLADAAAKKKPAPPAAPAGASPASAV